MATRIYCDHCGHTISGKAPNKFSFGPELQMMTGYIPTTVMPQPAVIPTPTAGIETIDLCDNCVNIWMTRVRNLCRASEPQPMDDTTQSNNAPTP